MLFLSVGLPGRFAEWCDRAVTHLAGRLGGPVITRSWPSLAEMFGYESLPSTLDYIAAPFIQTPAAHVVLGARQPDESLYAALAETGARFVLVLDDPRAAAAEMLGASQGEPKTVTRAVANSCALVMRYSDLPGALTIHASRAWADMPGTLAAITDHFGISMSRTEIQTVQEDLAGSGLASITTQRQEWAANVTETVSKMIDGALAGYAREFAGVGLDQIIWTRELFYLATDASRSPVEPIDAAGGSRIVIYGPYIHLPSGTWTARIVLGFSPGAVGYAFTVDVFSEGVLASATFQPERAGIYATELGFSLREVRGQGVEARVAVASDNAKGEVAFGHVVLRRIAARHSVGVTSTENDFLAALEL